MNNDWKQIGWKITRKLIYYAIVIFVLVAMFTASFSLMSIASTISFAAGLLLAAFTSGIGLTLAVREILYYCSDSSNNEE